MNKRSYQAVWIVSVLVLGAISAQDKEVPDKPHNLRALTRLEGAVGVVALSWQDGSDDETGFEILRGDNGGEFQVIRMIGANTSRFEDKVGKYVIGSFAYKVRAFSEEGRSEDSNTVSVWF